MEAVFIERKAITAVLLIFFIALVFSTSTAFAANNTTNTSSTVKTTTNLAAGSAAAGSSVSFTRAQINTAAKSTKSYIETYKKLPSYITIGKSKVTMPQFLNLMVQNVININSKTTRSVTLTTVNSPSNAAETVKTGNIYKSEYIKIAATLKSYMKTYKKAPNYIATSKGRINFKTMVYTYTKILSFQKTYNRLPKYVSVKNWNQITGEGTTYKNLRPVYITCDLISNTRVDTARNNALATALQKLGVKAVNYGVKGAVWNLLKDNSVPRNALIIEILGGADAAYIKEKGSAWYQNALGSKKIFLVFTDCAKDITGLAWLERAHDDNYSPASFKGLAHPDQYLLSHGVGYFEPLTSSNYATCAQAIYKYLLSC